MKRFISKNLVFEGMRQLRLVGIIGIIIAVLLSFFTVYGINTDAKRRYEYNYAYETSTSNDGATVNFEAGGDISNYIREIRGSWSCATVKVTAFVLAPLFMLILFSFMNKRNSSDFYHGIADRRECLGISFSLSVLIWCIMTMLSSFVTAVITTGILPFVVLSKDFFPAVCTYILEAVVISFYFIGLMLFAMSLSGTLITNLAVAAMILFLPKVLYLALMGTVVSDIDIYPFAYDDSILSGRYNLVTKPINRLLFGQTGADTWESIAYTAVLGAVLFAFGMAVFKLRKSEAATQAAVNGKLQLVFRLIPAFVITIIPCIFIYNSIVYSSGIDDWILFVIIVFYVIAILAYFLYEIITTRKWRNIIKAVPGLLILVLLDVIYTGAMIIQREAILNNVPKDTTAVKIIGTAMYDMNSDDYFKVRSSEIAITDEKIISILENSLIENIEDIRDNSGNMYSKNRLLVEFDEGNKKLYRLVFVEAQDYANISRIMGSNSSVNFITDIAALPYTDFGTDLFGYGIKDSLKKEIMDKYMQEIEMLSADEIYRIIFSEYYSSETIDYIRLTVKYNGKSYYVNLPVFYSMDLSKWLIELHNEACSGNIMPVSDFLEKSGNLPQDGEMYTDMRIEYKRASENVNGKAEYYQYAYLYADSYNINNGDNRSVLTELAEILENIENYEFEAGMDYIIIDYNFDGGKENYLNCQRIYVIDKAAGEKIEELIDSFER